MGLKTGARTVTDSTVRPKCFCPVGKVSFKEGMRKGGKGDEKRMEEAKRERERKRRERKDKT